MTATALRPAAAITAALLLLAAAHQWNLWLSSGNFGSAADGKISVARNAALTYGSQHDASKAVPTTLPHRLGNADAGFVNYRLTLPTTGSTPASGLYGVCIPRWSSNPSVSLNGERLFHLDGADIAARELNRAGYLTLPQGLPEGDLFLDVRLRIVPGTMPGLSEVWFGDAELVRQECVTLQDVSTGARVGSVFLMVMLFLTVGGIFFYTRDVLAKGIAVMAALWIVHSLVLLDWIPFADGERWVALLHITRPLPPIAAICVALYLSKALSKRVQYSLAFVSLAGYAVFPFLPVTLWSTWLIVQLMLLLPFILLACYRLVLHASRTHQISDFLFAVSMLFATGVHLMDFARNKGWLPYSGLSLTFMGAPLFSVGIGILVLERLAEFLRQQRLSAALLAERLKQQKDELDAAHELLQEQRDRILRNQERQRMLQDMHDGLGSQLVSASALLKSGQNLTAHSKELTALVDNALLDLRSLLDVFSTAGTQGKRDDDTLSLLLSMLRHRLMPIFRAQGIRLEWDAQALPAGFLPDDRQRLQLLRLLQEACTNIIKHAQASSVTFSTRADARQIELEIRDNGCGFTDASEALAPSARTRHGLNNMHVRANRLGAELIIASDTRGTSVRVIFAHGNQ